MTDNELTTLCEGFDLMYTLLTSGPSDIKDAFTEDEYQVICESRELIDRFYGGSG